MLVEHQFSHGVPDELPFKCDLCHRGFKRKRQLQAHANTHSGNFKELLTTTTYQASTGAAPFKCHICGAGFKSTSRLAHHKRKHHHSKAQPVESQSSGSASVGNVFESLEDMNVGLEYVIQENSTFFEQVQEVLNVDELQVTL